VGKTSKEGIFIGFRGNIYSSKLQRNLTARICPLLLGTAQPKQCCTPSNSALYSPANRPCTTQNSPCTSQQTRPLLLLLYGPETRPLSLLLYGPDSASLSVVVRPATRPLSQLLYGLVRPSLAAVFDLELGLSPSCQITLFPQPNHPLSLLLKCVLSPLTPTLYIFIFTLFPLLRTF
jgi:hypothetical protein